MHYSAKRSLEIACRQSVRTFWMPLVYTEQEAQLKQGLADRTAKTAVSVAI